MSHGVTHFTRWFVARQAGGEATAGGGWLSGGAQQPQPSHFIFIRGVSWRSADINALRVWQGLMKAVPSNFLPHLTSPPDLLVAHRWVWVAGTWWGGWAGGLSGPHPRWLCA